MTSQESNQDVQLSEELQSIVDKLSSQANAAGNKLSEDEIQIALSDFDTDADELSDVYQALRAQHITITADVVNLDDDDLLDDDLKDDDEEDPDLAAARAETRVVVPAGG